MIKPCICVNEVQDAMFGVGLRQHNIIEQREVTKSICTVCRRINGVKGKMQVRKHPCRTKEYREGMNFYSH